MCPISQQIFLPGLFLFPPRPHSCVQTAVQWLLVEKQIKPCRKTTQLPSDAPSSPGSLLLVALCLSQTFSLFLQQKLKLETADPTPTAPSTITLLQPAQKNHSQSVNGSSDTTPLQQNSTVDTSASSNSSDVGEHTTTATAMAPTQAGEGAVLCSGWCHTPRQQLPIFSSFSNMSCPHLLIMS